jgi:Putative zinc-finger
MNCQRIERLLSKQLDRRLTRGEAQAVAEHLEDCPACRRLWEEFTSVRARLPKPGASLRVSDVDHRAIGQWLAEREATAQIRRPGFLALAPLTPALRAPLGAAIAASLVVLLAWWIHGRGGQPSAVRIAQNPPHGQTTTAPPPVRHLPLNPADGRIVRGESVLPSGTIRPLRLPRQPHRRSRSEGNEEHRALTPRPGRQTRVDGNLARVNADRMRAARQGVLLPANDWETLERQVRLTMPVRDDFVQVPFPRLASTSDRQIAAAVESYKREAAIVDSRLSREVGLHEKGIALSDLCDELRSDTGINVAAGQSVADEKVTIFCEKHSLRDVMRQLSRPFGYAWLRNGKPGEYRYELVQDLRSQLLEEELRNRDRKEALLALDREMERFRPYLGLSPDEALAKAKTASPAEKPLLEKLSGYGWGPIQMYFRLSPRDLAALRSGQGLSFAQEPRPDRPAEQVLPLELVRGVLQSGRDIRVRDDRSRGGRLIPGPITNEKFSDGLPMVAVPEVRVRVRLGIGHSELGQFTFDGGSAFVIENAGTSRGREWAVGMSPTVLNPENARANARWAGDPAMRARVAVRPRPSCRPSPVDSAVPAEAKEPRMTSADVLEALHRASGLPIVSDYYTRLVPASAVSVQNMPLIDALNRLADAMRLHWSKEGNWLQFRSVSYYDDRLKEVPNRLLTRWADSRRQHGSLTLEDLIEVSELTDVQLNSDTIAEGVRECFGLEEWDLVRSGNLLPHLRYLASLTPAQLQMTTSDAGLPFTRLSLQQQQQLIAHLGSHLHSLEELPGAVVRVEYNQPGGFRWAIPQAADPGRGFFGLSPVRERTREAALVAARRIDPKVDVAQIAPTQLELAVVYVVVDPKSGKAMELGTRSTAQGGRVNW